MPHLAKMSDIQTINNIKCVDLRCVAWLVFLFRPSISVLFMRLEVISVQFWSLQRADTLIGVLVVVHPRSLDYSVHWSLVTCIRIGYSWHPDVQTSSQHM